MGATEYDELGQCHGCGEEAMLCSLGECKECVDNEAAEVAAANAYDESTNPSNGWRCPEPAVPSCTCEAYGHFGGEHVALCPLCPVHGTEADHCQHCGVYPDAGHIFERGADGAPYCPSCMPNLSKPMRTVCCVKECQKVLVDVPEDERGISHGFCEPCAQAVLDRLPLRLNCR